MQTNAGLLSAELDDWVLSLEDKNDDDKTIAVIILNYNGESLQ